MVVGILGDIRGNKAVVGVVLQSRLNGADKSTLFVRGSIKGKSGKGRLDMEREILFRGKTLDGGEWVYGDFCQSDITEATIHINSGRRSGLHRVIDLETVGQYTGLTDRDGKRVFEGDILAFWSDYHKKEIVDGVVRYGEFNCSCCDGVYGWYVEGGDIRELGGKHTRLYVVGNIYDNPELLSGR